VHTGPRTIMAPYDPTAGTAYPVTNRHGTFTFFFQITDVTLPTVLNFGNIIVYNSTTREYTLGGTWVPTTAYVPLNTSSGVSNFNMIITQMSSVRTV